jgi:uncharacterized protein YndB with AHSA1/START domain
VTEIAPVEVTVQVPAAPQDVFGFFTDPARYVQWMGSEADLEPVPGGVYRVRMADGFCAAGRFLAVEPPHLVVFSWGSPTTRRPRGPSTRAVRRAARAPCRPAAPRSR